MSWFLNIFFKPEGFRLKPEFIAVLLLLASTCLALTNLDNCYLWGDEADAALVAKNFLATGQLKNWDNGSLSFNAPPVMYFIVSLSFYFLGATTWTARFPFVIAGLVSLFLFAFIVRKQFRSTPALWLYALAVMSLSVPFLLYVRQCRYYSIAVLFCLTTYYFYHRCLERPKNLHFIAFAFAAFLLFFSNYLLGLSFILTLACVHLVFYHCRLDPMVRKKFDWIALPFLVCTLLVIGHFRMWNYTSVFYVDILRHPDWLFRMHLEAFSHLNRANVLPWMLIPLLVYFLCACRKRDGQMFRTICEWGLFAAGNAILLVVLIKGGIYGNQRFVLLSFPFCAGLIGYLLWEIHRRFRPAAYGIFLVLICTTSFSGTIARPVPGWYLPLFLQEILHEYPTITEETVKFFSIHARPGDSIRFVPNGSLVYPVLFYMGKSIRPCVSAQDVPDWLIVQGALPKRGTDLFAESGKSGAAYAYVETLNVFGGEIQRPEIGSHHFGPRRDFDSRQEGIHIFKKAISATRNTATP